MASQFSHLSRGFGTWNGAVVRDTPSLDSDSSENEEALFGKRGVAEKETLRVLQELQRSFSAQSYQTKGFRREFFNRLRCHEAEDAVLHKTYSTRRGALLLFSEEEYLSQRRKRRRLRTKDRLQLEQENLGLESLGTCEDLVNMILEFGNDGSKLFKNLSRSLRDENPVNVRPGYSPSRYIASLTKLWDPEFLDKFFFDNALHEPNLKKYSELKLPPIRVGGTTQSPLLKERPKPYSTVSLPHVPLRRSSADNLDTKDPRKSVDLTESVDEPGGHQYQANSSTGYPESHASLGTNKKRQHKKTLKTNVLELEMPGQKPTEARYFSESDNDSDSQLEWEVLKEASRLAIQKTFTGLDEDVTGSDNNRPQHPIKQHRVLSNGAAEERISLHDAIEQPNRKQSLTSSVSSAAKWKETLENVSYASLDPHQKQDLISELLLHGAVYEATDLDSITSNIDIGSFNKSTDLSSFAEKSASLPVIDNNSPPSFEGKTSQSLSACEKIKSSRNFIVGSEHSTQKLKWPEDSEKMSSSSDSFPSIRSHKSKSSTNTNSSKTSGHSVLFSLFKKLPPIMSEPPTPYTEDPKRNVPSQEVVTQGVNQIPKFPYISKKLSGGPVTKEPDSHTKEPHVLTTDAADKGHSLNIHGQGLSPRVASNETLKQIDHHLVTNSQSYEKTNQQGGPLSIQGLGLDSSEIVVGHARRDGSPVPYNASEIDKRPEQGNIFRIEGFGFGPEDAPVDMKDINVKFDENMDRDGDHIDETESRENFVSDVHLSTRAQEEGGIYIEGEALIADGGLLDSASIDSGRGTGTGFTVSHINLPASGNQPALEPAMSTVTEESLRSSKESRHLHKEYIRNGTVASDNHEDSGIKQQRDELEIIGKDNNFTGGLPQTINETDDTTLTDKTSETDGAEADHKSLEAPEEELKYGTEDSSLKTNQGEDNVERTSGDTMEENLKDDTKDEGVVLNDGEHIDQQQIASPVMSENYEKEFSTKDKSAESSDRRPAEMSVDGSEDQHENSLEDNQQSFDQDLEFLQTQAQTAASEALSGPKTGVDLLQDMKIASKLFEEMLQENLDILRQRGRRRSTGVKSRADTDLTGGSALSSHLTIDERNRSCSAMRVTPGDGYQSVNVEELKANMQSLDYLIKKKTEKMKQSRKGSSATREKTEGSKSSGQLAERSITSLPAKSVPDIRTEADIQMDIFGYGHTETEAETSNVDTRKERSENDQVNGASQGISSDEEKFREALNAIVEDVKGLTEHKREPAKAKLKRKPKKLPNQKNASDGHDRLYASPPFHTGKAKDSMVPPGLKPFQEVSPNDSSVKGKKRKDVGKDKIKKGKTDRKKKQADAKQNDSLNTAQNFTEELIPIVDEPSPIIERPVEISNDQSKIETAVSKLKEEVLDGSPKTQHLDTETLKAATSPKGIPEDFEFVFKRTPDTLDSGEPPSELPRSQKGPSSFVPHAHLESETDQSVAGSDTESGVPSKVLDARLRKRQLAAEKRRLEVERKRKEKEEARRKAILEAEMEERLRQEAEEEKLRRIEEYKRRKEEEELERKRLEEEEKDKLRQLEREKERKRRESAEVKRKMAAFQAQLKLEEELRLERERLAKQIEEEMRRREQELLEQMKEEERIAYEERKRIEEEVKRKEEEERLRIQEEKRIREEEDTQRKMKELKELQRILLERQAFWEGMRNSKHFLELDQRLTRAFTFSYYKLLPAILFPFVSLRPFSSDDPSPKLPTIQEEREE